MLIPVPHVLRLGSAAVRLWDCGSYPTAVPWSPIIYYFFLRVKLQSVSYCFDVADSEYDNQIALSPTIIKGEGTNLKNYVCNKNVIIGF